MNPQNMPGPDENPAADAGARGPTLTAEEFAVRFEGASRVLWTVAAGVLGDSTEAEDVLQEACLMALGKLEQFRSGTSYTAWMGRFVRNVALNHARKRTRRATRPEAPEVLTGLAPEAAPLNGSPAPVDEKGRLVPDQGAFDDRVLAGLQNLNPVARACLLLRVVLEMSYREIAAALELPEGTAMSHVHRAREALRVELTENRTRPSGIRLEGLA